MKLCSRNMKGNYQKFNTFQHYSSLDKKWRGRNGFYLHVENGRKLRKKHILKTIFILGRSYKKLNLNIAQKYVLNMLKFRSKRNKLHLLYKLVERKPT